MLAINQFEKQQYLNVETFRKNGNGVKTPVWFVQDGENLIVWTETTSGKARRVRNRGEVNIAPCKADGTLLGDWVAASAKADDSDAALSHLKQLMARKYGIAFHLFGLMGKLRRSKYTSILVELGK
ncbi:MAG: PPOX class F420-dependent oxidoreductase [Chloroflexi bacterium]|nr:PPOX class F420-dependent oxidoreductase [Chloroflexota bacterium]